MFSKKKKEERPHHHRHAERGSKEAHASSSSSHAGPSSSSHKSHSHHHDKDKGKPVAESSLPPPTAPPAPSYRVNATVGAQYPDQFGELEKATTYYDYVDEILGLALDLVQSPHGQAGLIKLHVLLSERFSAELYPLSTTREHRATRYVGHYTPRLRETFPLTVSNYARDDYQGRQVQAMMTRSCLSSPPAGGERWDAAAGLRLDLNGFQLDASVGIRVELVRLRADRSHDKDGRRARKVAELRRLDLEQRFFWMRAVAHEFAHGYLAFFSNHAEVYEPAQIDFSGHMGKDRVTGELGFWFDEWLWGGKVHNLMTPDGQDDRSAGVTWIEPQNGTGRKLSHAFMEEVVSDPKRYTGSTSHGVETTVAAGGLSSMVNRDQQTRVQRYWTQDMIARRLGTTTLADDSFVEEPEPEPEPQPEPEPETSTKKSSGKGKGKEKKSLKDKLKGKGKK